MIREKYPQFKYKEFYLYLDDKILLDSYKYDEIKLCDEIEIKLINSCEDDEYENQLYINIRINENDNIKIEYDENNKVLNIKEKTKELFGLYIKNQELIFDNNVLDDDESLLKDLNINESDEIRLNIVI